MENQGLYHCEECRIAGERRARQDATWQWVGPITEAFCTVLAVLGILVTAYIIAACLVSS